MKITIAERLHPFSHEIGTKFLLPKSSWTVEVFPTRLNFYDLEGKGDPFNLCFDFTGPIQGFTAELDLEQGCLSVFGMTRKGHMCYRLCAKEDGIWLTMEKIPEEKVLCRRSFPPQECSLSQKESMIVCLALRSAEKMASQERLSLGMHKAQDWDLARRRLDSKEIFPHWFVLAGLIPSKDLPVENAAGNFSLLHACRKKIEHLEKETVLQAFEHLFLSAFEGVLVPRLTDSGYQGIVPELENTPLVSPLPLLTESGRLIRSLFFQEKNSEVSLLPCLPPQFHCGRMVRMRTSHHEMIDFEWTKKTLRGVLITSASGGEMHLKLPKGIRHCRLKSGRMVTKKIAVDPEGRVVLSLEANRTFQLDRLEF